MDKNKSPPAFEAFLLNLKNNFNVMKINDF